MPHKSIALYDLLQPDFSQIEKIGWNDRQTKDEIKKIQQTLEQEVSDLDWKTVKKELYKQLDSLLNISLAGVLARAWIALAQVQQIIREQQEDGSDSVAVIPLVEHKILSQHEPKLKILLNSHNIGELKFVVKFIFKLEGVLLKIQYGKIQAVLAGKCKGAAAISYEEVKLEEKQIAEFDLPGQLDLLKNEEQQQEEERELADDILSDDRTVQASNIEIQSQKEISTPAPISFSKKLALLLIGVLISIFIIATLMILI